MSSVTLFNGHVLPILQSLLDESVHCCITSPPYWALRDYGLEPQVWGGDKGCPGHEWGDFLADPVNQGGPNGAALDISGAQYSGLKDFPSGPNSGLVGHQPRPDNKSNFCRHCGAWRGSYGLEPTIELYIEHTVQVFREVRRVLRPGGTLFLNLGDSYYGGGGAHKDHHANPGLSKSASRNGVPKCIGKAVAYNDGPNRQLHPGLKPKDLCGVPWRVALALQADGWWLRSDIIWAKGTA